MEEEIWIDLKEWLENAEPSQWHSLAQDWEWENGIKGLQWIISNPKCDKATALLIYWAADPNFYYQFNGIENLQPSNNNRQIFDFLLDIEAKYTTNYYTINNWNYDPTNDVYGGNLVALDASDEKLVVHQIPDLMKTPLLEGKEFDNYIQIEDGLPFEVYEKFYC